MARTVHVIARFVAKPGRENELKAALTALIPPSRRELGCYQYDLLENPAVAGDFCFVERWENDKAIDQHSASGHVNQALAQVEALVESPPDIRRYRQV
jgi:quinol monooxygenase YgiN